MGWPTTSSRTRRTTTSTSTAACTRRARSARNSADRSASRSRSPGIPRPGFAVSGGERSGRELAGGLVAADHHPRRRDATLDQPQRRWHRAFREQPLARPDQHREDQQLELVDEPVAQQRLEQVAAPVDLELPTILLLEPADRLGDVSFEEHRALPLKAGAAA